MTILDFLKPLTASEFTPKRFPDMITGCAHSMAIKTDALRVSRKVPKFLLEAALKSETETGISPNFASLLPNMDAETIVNLEMLPTIAAFKNNGKTIAVAAKLADIDDAGGGFVVFVDARKLKFILELFPDAEPFVSGNSSNAQVMFARVDDKGNPKLDSIFAILMPVKVGEIRGFSKGGGHREKNSM